MSDASLGARLLERLAIGEVRIQRGRQAMGHLAGLERPLTAGDVGLLDEAVAHLGAAIDALVLLKRELSAETDERLKSPK